ncbi:hypothetical protein [Aeromonas sp. EERV15]|uniref:hypothetical protein n=1 Tax=Aeromonas sp. EERV15 TaxID=1833892 RepID=UPI00083A4E44|nr:hypothetical protein [Aeromonas sp. EERV15]
MAPNLVQTYRKQLDTSPDGMTDKISFQTLLIHQPNLAVLRLTEYEMAAGADFHRCLVVEEIGVDEWITNAIEAGEDIYAYVENGLTGDDIIIGRFVYNHLSLTIAGARQDAIQIRGAFIDPDYRSGLARMVYQRLREQYSCVISDDMQTISGALLWLIGINQISQQRIELYDFQQQRITGHLDYPIKPGSFKPWCLTGLDHQQITKESSRKFDVVDYAGDEDRRHIVFLLR